MALQVERSSDGRFGQKDLCELLEVSDETLRTWRRQGCPAVVERGRPRFRVAEVWAWRLDRARRAAEPVTLTEARRRKIAAEARLAEIRAEMETGALVPVETFRQAVAASHARVRAKLLAMPCRTAPRLVGIRSVAEAVKIIDQEVQVTMAELRGPGPRATS